MASPALMGLFVAAAALALFWITAYWQIEGATGREPRSLWSPWASGPWSASEGNGSPGGSPRQRAADDPTVAAIWAFRPAILRWVLKRDVPKSEAEDLAQIILENAWKSRRRWDPESCTLHCWLYVIMRNHVHTYQHRGHVRYETLVADPRGRAVAQEDPAAAAEAWQYCQRALTILGRMPPALLTLFTRYEIEDEPMFEVAAALGLPLSTAWAQLQQARGMIAREVAREAAIDARRRPSRRG